MAATIQQIVKPTRARGLDTSGNNNHAQIYSGRALEFDGVTDYLNLGAETTFSTGACTISCWVNIANYASSVADHLVDSSATSSFSNVGFDTSGHLAVYDYGGGTWRDSNSILQKNTWYRVVYSYDGSGTLTFYINGVADGTGVIDTSGDNDDCIVEYIGKRHNDTRYFDGMMSDFQIWDAAWTAADAEYDYLNPEQLVLNRGGTSLTNSNLKLWYPMNEGHRGNQSYVLDASNTGIGENIVDESVSTGDSITGLQDFGDTGVSLEDGAIKVLYNTHASGMYFYLRDTNILTEDLIVGRTYKITLRVKMSDSQVTFKIQGSDPTVVGETISSTEYVETSLLFNATSTTGHYFFTHFDDSGSRVSGQTTLYIDSITVKPINAKNNATTVFYGDDLFDSGVGDYGDSTGGWTPDGNNTVDNNDTALRITFVDDDDGARLDLNNAEDLIADLVVGRIYRLTFTYKINQVTGSNVILQINTGDGTFVSTAGLNSTSYATLTKDFTATHATGAEIKFNNMDSGDILHVKDFKLQEIGIASGWTDADQQLDIPQTALQSYNQLAWYDGKDNYHQTSSDITPGDHTSVSFWVFINQGGASDSYGLLRTGTYGDQNFRILGQTDKLDIVTYNEDESTVTETHSFATTVELGQWHHIAAYIPRQSGNSVILYFNGQKLTTDAMARDMKVEAHNWRLGLGYGITYQYLQGAMTEFSYFNVKLTDDEFLELYNNGKALNALDHSQAGNLVHYWRNEGLGNWNDLKGSNNLTPAGSPTETMLITAGADSSRDSQGFLMNRQRLTNTINGLYTGSSGGGTYNAGAVVQDSSTLDITGAFTIGCWVKLKDFNYSYNLIEKKTSWNSAGYGIYIHKSSKKPYLEWSNGSDVQQASGGTNDTDTLDVWYFVYGVHDPDGLHNSGTGIDRLYSAKTTDTSLNSDGKTSMHAGSIDGAVGTNDLPLTIGNHYGGGQASSASIHFTGEIDDVVVYNKALSPEEVLRNFKAGKRSHR